MFRAVLDLSGSAARGGRADVWPRLLRHAARVEEERIDRGAMEDPDVIAVEESLDHHLPVAALLARDALADDMCGESERGELLVDLAEVNRYIGRFGAERRPHEPVSFLDA